jgi:lipopolysaccharide/colanic/teichoic acid biosynthesis glycosyltransferase
VRQFARQNDDGPGLQGLSVVDRAVKRSFDIVAAAVGLVLTWWIIVLAYIASSIDTRRSGFFVQGRVGREGKLFKMIKIRTMRDVANINTAVTADNDPRITGLGRFLRRAKIDELPQLVNILLGQMSFVGPRPDVPGFADQLLGKDRIILSVRPGITGPATLRFRDEERVLAQHPDPERYNREVIFPEKVKLNREYVQAYSFRKDMGYILRTLFGR